MSTVQVDSHGADVSGPGPEQRDEADDAFTTRPVLRVTFGMLASGHYTSAAIGLRVLEQGGNAVGR